MIALAPRGTAQQWVIENRGKHKCKVCGKPIEILKRHFWMGIPKHHGKCYGTQLILHRLDPIREAGLVTASELARAQGIGRTTVNRWIKSGTLPQPTLMLGAVCFPKALLAPVRSRG